MKPNHCPILTWTLALAASLAFSKFAYAAAVGGGGGMPWDAPLTALQTDLTGTTATAISLIGIVAVFGVLIFGGELNHFFRTLCYIILLVSVLVAGQNVLTALGITGATVENRAGYDIWGFISGVIITSLAWAGGLALRRRYRLQQKRLADEAATLTVPR